jgi:hypothetical protein
MRCISIIGGAKKKEESDSEVEFGSGSEESSSEEEDDNAKKKVPVPVYVFRKNHNISSFTVSCWPTLLQGVEGLIELENPNRVKQKMKKVSQLSDPTATSSSEPAAAKKAPAGKYNTISLSSISI